MERCELLNRYDTNNDGTMGMTEVMDAARDHNAGIISHDDVEAVSHAWKMGEGGVLAMCPEPEILEKGMVSVLIPYAVAFVVAYTLIKTIWK